MDKRYYARTCTLTSPPYASAPAALADQVLCFSSRVLREIWVDLHPDRRCAVSLRQAKYCFGIDAVEKARRRPVRELPGGGGSQLDDTSLIGEVYRC